MENNGRPGKNFPKAIFQLISILAPSGLDFTNDII
jgi:hypothetical protein